MASTNRLLMQTFEWHTPSSPTHYTHLKYLLPQLAKIGVTSIWLPPGCKANNPNGNGYDIYDLWDLGEFEQKGSRGTKWGDREELNELLRVAKESGVEVIWDAVINHKQGGDRTEDGIWAVEVDKDDRRYEISSPKQIEAWLRYDFPGRARENMKYSNMTWRAEHFNGTDWDQSRKKNAIYKLIDDPSSQPSFEQPRKPKVNHVTPPRSRLSVLRRQFSSQSRKKLVLPPAPARRPGKGWAEDVDSDHGNNDYLLFSNIGYSHPEVRKEVLNWGNWMVQDINVQGFRLDAVQHFSYNFTRDWILHVNESSRKKTGNDTFIVGEVWAGELQRILKWLDAVQTPSGPCVYAYDSPLVYNFSRISEDFRTRSRNTDLRTIVRDSLLQNRPEAAVTLVTNHDTQPGQTCYTPMHAKLKALFYAFILLRQDGYPCVFWGDLFGTRGPHAEGPACMIQDDNRCSGRRSILPDLIMCRKVFAYGRQRDYWESSTCIGWTRAGRGNESGCAVVLNIGWKGGVKSMQVGNPGEIWVDVLGVVKEEVNIDGKGFACFPCKATAVSVFIHKEARGLSDFPVEFDLDIYRS